MGLSTGTVCCGCAQPLIWRFGIYPTYLSHIPYGIIERRFVVVEGDTNGFFRSLGVSDAMFTNLSGTLTALQIGGYVDLKKLSGTNWELEVFINGVGRNTATFSYDFLDDPANGLTDVTMILDDELQIGVAVTLATIDNRTLTPYTDRLKDEEPARFSLTLPNTDRDGLIEPSLKGLGKVFVEEDMDPAILDTGTQNSPGYIYDFDDPAIDYVRAWALISPIAYGVSPYSSAGGGIGLQAQRQVFPFQACAEGFIKQPFDNYVVENPDYPTKRLDFEIDVGPYTSRGFATDLLANLGPTFYGNFLSNWGSSFFSDDEDLYDDSHVATALEPYLLAGRFLVRKGQSVFVTIDFGNLRIDATTTYDLFAPGTTPVLLQTLEVKFEKFVPAVGSNTATIQNVGFSSFFISYPGDIASIDIEYGYRPTLTPTERWNIPGRTITNPTTRSFYLRMPKLLITQGKNITPGFNWRLQAGQNNIVGGLSKFNPATTNTGASRLTIRSGSLPPGTSLVTATTPNSRSFFIRGNIPENSEGSAGFVQLAANVFGFVSEPYYWEIGTATNVVIVYPTPYTNSDIQPAAGFDWRIDDSDEYEIEATIINAADPVTVTLESGDLPPGGILDAATGRIHSDGLAIFQNPATGSCVLKVVDDELKEGLSVTYNWQYFGEEDPVFGSQLYPSPYTNSATPPAAGFDWRIDGANAVSILPIGDFTTTAHTFEIEAGSLPPESLLDATTGEIATPTVFVQQPGDSTGSVRIKVTRTSDSKSKISRDYTWEYKGL